MSGPSVAQSSKSRTLWFLKILPPCLLQRTFFWVHILAIRKASKSSLQKKIKVFKQRHCFAFTCAVKPQLIPEFALNFSSDLPLSLLVGDGPCGFFPSPCSSPGHSPLHTRLKTRTFTFLSFSYSKLSIRFQHILLEQLHQENDSACGINYACTWPGTKGYEVGEGRIVRHTQIKSPWISQMDPISSSYCRKSSCT